MYELDLHGHTADEALRIFVDAYNRRVRSGSRLPLRIIHGYGSSGEGGKIRRRIRVFLETAAASLEWKCGEDQEGNPGTTIVYPARPLPSQEDRLAAEILAFCSVPRTESKIASQFRKYVPREVKQAIRTLVRQAQMKELLKGGHETYVSAVAEVRSKET